MAVPLLKRKRGVTRVDIEDHVKLIIQPDAGLAPVAIAIKQAKKTIDVLIFASISRKSHAAWRRRPLGASWSGL